MSVAISDVAPLIRDYSRNQFLTDARVFRVATTAIRFLKEHMGLPGHEREHTFNFFDDDITFSLPTDWGEAISIRFDDDQLNSQQRFTYKPVEFLFERVKAVDMTTRLWGVYGAGGTLVAYVLAKNSTSGATIDTFDANDDTNWVASLDATNLHTDNLLFKEGAASLAFDVDVSSSGSNRATITSVANKIGPFDLSALEDISYFKCWVYLPTVTSFTSISFTWGSSASNYWKQTVTAQEDGSAFKVGWNELSFQWNGATPSGSPDSTSVSYYVFDFDYAGAFADADGFHIDFLRVEKPDVMISTYYTTHVGKTSAGTYLDTFSATTDVFLFTDPSLMELVALEAAKIVNPTLLVDDAAFKALYTDFWTLYSRKYPKKFLQSLRAEPRTARTSTQSP